ncbi:MAG: TIGR02996 domain-containing protein [Planctomycetes bacterium]|nr:TIGR02996 domain-containing protein [Planctomycetota bacterium]
MNEDEAFIRAIVDNPGDDTPRLVYADWLDDHDDPRGPYLRAEHEWAATHDPSESETLRQLAKKLDPVWAARVSRPPIGVRTDTADAFDRGPVVTDSDISAVEHQLGATFSPDYRAFLLNHNGCCLKRLWGIVNGETIYNDIDLKFYPLLGEGIQPSVANQIAHYRDWVNQPDTAETTTDSSVRDAFLSFLPIGYADYEWIFLGTRAPYIGQIATFEPYGILSLDRIGSERWPPFNSLAEYLAR